MKILYLITKSNWGGAQRHVYDLAVHMKEGGHDVSVALGGDGLLRTRLEDAGIYTHSIPSLGRDIRPGKDASSFRDIFSVIRHRKPNVLHLHSPKAAGLGALAGRILRVKKILFTVHGWSFNEDRPFFQKILIAISSWATIILCHQVIVLSEREYIQALRFPGAKHKVKIVPLGIKPPTFYSIEGSRSAVAKMIGMNSPDISKKIIIGTIAELHRNKGLNYLISAVGTVLHDHPSAISIIMSDGEEKETLKKMVLEFGLEKKVFLTGYVENAAEYLKGFTMFVLPSVKEGLPYVIMEAGYASLPVVATTVGGIPELIEDMKSGILVQPRNHRELAHAISFMIEHPAERRKYGAALRERIQDRYSIQKMFEKIEKIYFPAPTNSFEATSR